tara:strand:+ start:3132 stop:3395 length:264 start_codon:yes stop_codon:yes gene_type:complete
VFKHDNLLIFYIISKITEESKKGADFTAPFVRLKIIFVFHCKLTLLIISKCCFVLPVPFSAGRFTLSARKIDRLAITAMAKIDFTIT